MLSSSFSCLLVGVIVIAFGGCNRHSDVNPTSNDSAKADESTNLSGKLDPLYRRYLEGSAVQAEECLNQSIKIAQESKASPQVKSHALWLAYARMYVLRTRTNNDKANEDFVSTQHWFRRELECEGIAREKVAEAVNAMTTVKVQKIVNDWDNHATHEKGPSYISKAESEKGRSTVNLAADK
jgi:hypothetical protein